MDDFAKGKPAERQPYFQETAARRNSTTTAVEKDFWICWTLKHLFELEGIPELRFKGGSAVSHSVNSNTIQAKSAPERDAARHSGRMHESAIRYERIGPRRISEDRNGQSGLSTCEVCASAGALIMPKVRTPMTSDVCVSLAIRIVELIILSSFVLVLPRR